MKLYLLQEIALPPDTTTAALAAPAAEGPDTWLEMLMLGGWVMIPLALCSVLALYVFVERLVTLHRAESDPERTTERVRSYVQSGDVRGALSFCASHNTPITRILQKGLERLGRPIAEIRDAVEAAGKHESFVLEKRTDVLANISGIAPMLGFLGTVTGMIDAFRQIQLLQGNVNPSVLAGGIWEALITTVAGLTIGIVAHVGYNFVLGRIRRLVNDMERSATDFIDLLQEPVPTRPTRYEKPLV